MGVARFSIPAKRSFDNAYPLVVNCSFLLEPTRQRARGGRKDSWKGLQQNRLHRSSFFLCQNLKFSIGMEMLAWPEPVLFINPDGVAPDKANKYRTLIYFPYCSVLFSRWWHKNLQLPTCFLSGSNMDFSHTTLNSVTEEGVSWWHFRLKQKQDDLLLSIPYSSTRLYYVILVLVPVLLFYKNTWSSESEVGSGSSFSYPIRGFVPRAYLTSSSSTETYLIFATSKKTKSIATHRSSPTLSNQS